MIRILLLMLSGTLLYSVELPICDQKSWSTTDLIISANNLIALGDKTAVVEALLTRSEEMNPNGPLGHSANERLGWLCRLVFVPNENVDFLRPPMLGGLSLPYKSMPFDRWPLFPVALTNGVPVVLSQGYSLGGRPEPAQAYLAYCVENGNLRQKPFQLPDEKVFSRAVDALFETKRWKAIEWSYASPNWTYSYSESWTQSAIRRQFAGVP